MNQFYTVIGVKECGLYFRHFYAKDDEQAKEIITSVVESEIEYNPCSDEWTIFQSHIRPITTQPQPKTSEDFLPYIKHRLSRLEKDSKYDSKKFGVTWYRNHITTLNQYLSWAKSVGLDTQ